MILSPKAKDTGGAGLCAGDASRFKGCAWEGFA